MPSAGKRAPAPSQSQTAESRPVPEKKFSAVGSGIEVAVWLNTSHADDGARRYRSLTVSPRRYRDKETGEWKDGSTYWPSDIAALVFALQKAQAYVFETPIPGDQSEEPVPTSNTAPSVP